MNYRSALRAPVATRASFACIAVVSLFAACESAESKQMKALAGNYVSVYEMETAPGESEPFASQRNTLTLRVDGRWVQTMERRIGTKEDTFSDSGAYRVQGTMVVLGATEQQPSEQMTISGDTLWLNGSSRAKLAEQVTGVKVYDSGVQSFMVRQR